MKYLPPIVVEEIEHATYYGYNSGDSIDTIVDWQTNWSAYLREDRLPDYIIVVKGNHSFAQILPTLHDRLADARKERKRNEKTTLNLK